MIADYFTKPLQGNLLNLFREPFMRYKHIGDILADIESSTKELAGYQNKVTEDSNLKK